MMKHHLPHNKELQRLIVRFAIISCTVGVDQFLKPAPKVHRRSKPGTWDSGEASLCVCAVTGQVDLNTRLPGGPDLATQALEGRVLRAPC